MSYSPVLELSELADGRMTSVEVAGVEILIAHVNGEVFALDDQCTHEDAQLSGGVLDGARVRCPLHGSWFCLRTGAPREEPADEPVRCHAARIRNGWIEVDTDGIDGSAEANR